MRIKNSTDTPQYFPYAGRKRRGVQLGPGEEGPEVPLTRLDERQGRRIPRDAESGVIKLVVSDKERVALKDVVSKKCLVCAGATDEPEEEVDEAPEEVANTNDDGDNDDTGGSDEGNEEAPAAEITVDDTTEDAPEEEPAAEEEAEKPVDAIAESLIADLTPLKSRSRSGKITHLKKSEDKGIQAALPAVIAHFEALKAQKDDPETDVYDAMSNAELMSAAVKAGLDVSPGDDDDKLRKALRNAK
jgi:hypothetical protein